MDKYHKAEWDDFRKRMLPQSIFWGIVGLMMIFMAYQEDSGWMLFIGICFVTPLACSILWLIDFKRELDGMKNKL